MKNYCSCSFGKQMRDNVFWVLEKKFGIFGNTDIERQIIRMVAIYYCSPRTWRGSVRLWQQALSSQALVRQGLGQMPAAPSRGRVRRLTDNACPPAPHWGEADGAAAPCCCPFRPHAGSSSVPAARCGCGDARQCALCPPQAAPRPFAPCPGAGAPSSLGVSPRSLPLQTLQSRALNRAAVAERAWPLIKHALWWITRNLKYYRRMYFI